MSKSSKKQRSRMFLFLSFFVSFLFFFFSLLFFFFVSQSSQAVLQKLFNESFYQIVLLQTFEAFAGFRFVASLFSRLI